MNPSLGRASTSCFRCFLRPCCLFRQPFQCTQSIIVTHSANGRSVIFLPLHSTASARSLSTSDLQIIVLLGRQSSVFDATLRATSALIPSRFMDVDTPGGRETASEGAEMPILREVASRLLLDGELTRRQKKEPFFSPRSIPPKTGLSSFRFSWNACIESLCGASGLQILTTGRTREAMEGLLQTKKLRPGYEGEIWLYFFLCRFFYMTRDI
ncbi:hypothetical protein FN846DRAFT_401329 [Sphaerosporella brunnea]|uniref:Uncharacterized protein n=1 Tax=Sphaerosporella brunnea TaxID=1250544 RepID=A0A5J5EHA2_9PEZI|nr:hypothetical protein FN846DRAFT_401329 [Sphaerosporella brunnea]